MVQGQPRQNVHETESQQLSGHSGACLSFPDMQGSSPGHLGHKVRLCLKNNQAKRAVVKHLPSKAQEHRPLNSIPSTVHTYTHTHTHNRSSVYSNKGRPQARVVVHAYNRSTWEAEKGGLYI
jgi:hypothetical protein